VLPTRILESCYRHPRELTLHSRLLRVTSKGQYTIFRQALTRPRHLVHKTKRRAKGPKAPIEIISPQRGQKTVSQSVFAH
jgi:hypothetical protein